MGLMANSRSSSVDMVDVTLPASSVNRLCATLTLQGAICARPRGSREALLGSKATVRRYAGLQAARYGRKRGEGRFAAEAGLRGVRALDGRGSERLDVVSV
jgi:hypothetical protein